MTEQTENDAIQATDFLVETNNPTYLDDTLQQLPNMNAFVVGRGVPGGFAMREGYNVVRVFGSTSWFEYAVTHQGYCKIIKKLDDLI
jgi:hypothetical protein